jgi:hypothetical protein
VIKSRLVRWARHKPHMGEIRNANKMPEGERLIREDNIKM